jgi:hypothetical protein
VYVGHRHPVLEGTVIQYKHTYAIMYTARCILAHFRSCSVLYYSTETSALAFEIASYATVFLRNCQSCNCHLCNRPVWRATEEPISISVTLVNPLAVPLHVNDLQLVVTMRLCEVRAATTYYIWSIALLSTNMRF